MENVKELYKRMNKELKKFNMKELQVPDFYDYDEQQNQDKILSSYQLHYKFKDAVSALKKVSENKLYTGERFVCTEVVAGEKCNNGGEYGFYKVYSPTTLSGIYRVDSSCTCDFDRCGTGFEGYIILTKSLYNYLISESDRIEEEGSLY